MTDERRTLIALTHRPSPRIAACELTFIEREPIDSQRAARQHEAYCRTLEACGAEVTVLSDNSSHPDAVFIEDTVIVLDELAIMASMAKASRRGEVPRIERELGRYRELRKIPLPATIEGGDVLRIQRTLYVGWSPRTNRAGLDALLEIVRPYGYRVVAVEVQGCVHLKTACSALSEARVLANPAWVDLKPFDEVEVVPVAAEEPWAANLLRVGRHVCMSSAFPRTIELVRSLGLNVVPLDMSEFHKAEAGPTCLSVLFRESLHYRHPDHIFPAGTSPRPRSGPGTS